MVFDLYIHFTGMSKAELGASISVPVVVIAVGIVVTALVLKLKYHHGRMKVSNSHEIGMENRSNIYQAEEAAAAEREVLQGTMG